MLGIFSIFASWEVSSFKRFGRLLNKEASEPDGTEAIMSLGNSDVEEVINIIRDYLRDFRIKELALSTTEVSRLAR